MLAVEMGGHSGTQEELRSVRARARVRHREDALTGVIKLEILVLELLPVEDLPPVPLWFVKSPPWHMKPGITRWKMLSLYPYPFSPVQSARKFSAVFGTMSP